MEPAASSEDETARLEALAAYGILDTAPEPPFDDLVSLASQFLQAPMAMLTLIDSRRQWFKARIGLAPAETPREIAFCDHTIRGKALFVVPDTRADERFRNNPLVLGEPNVRFYAGAPLKSAQGRMLGSLAVMDCVPRSLPPAQADVLKALARQAESQLELRLAMRTLAGANADLATFRDAVANDLRAPLRALNAALAALSSEALAEEPRRQAEEARQRAAELGGMLEALHDFARHSHAGGRSRPVDMRALAERAVAILEKTYAGASARMLIEPMPHALGSEPLLLNVWTSVISNVLQSATAGASLIEIGATPGADGVRYFVRDRSGSVAAGQRAAAGLGIARRIVERHGGTLSAASGPDKGVVVSFTVPPA